MSLSNRDAFLARVDHEHRPWHLRHTLNAAEEFLEALRFFSQKNNFLLGKHIKRSILLHPLQLLQPADALLNGIKVCERSPEPALIHIKHVATLSFFFNSFLRLLLRTHKKNGFTGSRKFTNKVVRFLDFPNRLLQVNDVNPISFRKNVPRHFWIPTTRLVTEMNSGLQQLFH